MNLHLLRKTNCISIYYDAGNDWLFLDWEGDLTLADVQVACLELSYCFLQRPYPRVLNSNVQVTNVSWSVAAWLACEFMPHLTLAGIEHLAWISSTSLRGRNMVQTVMNWLPRLTVNLFDDIEEAVYYLQQRRPATTMGYILPQRLPAAQAKLAEEVQNLRRKIGAHVPKTRQVYQ